LNAAAAIHATSSMPKASCGQQLLSSQTSFFLWKGLSSGQSGMTSAKLWRRERGFGTDNDYKRTTQENVMTYTWNKRGFSRTDTFDDKWTYTLV
jgi:hypothetical protein